MHTTPPEAVPCRTPQEQALSQATAAYFLNPGEKTFRVLTEHMVQTDPGQERPAALVLQAANAVLDQEATQLAQILAAQGGAVACSAGCDGCCHQLIVCYPFEAALIGLYMKEHPELLPFFEQAYQEWDARTRDMRETFLAWAERYYGKGVDDGTHTLADYKVPCLFLENNRCRIYPVRPYICRSCLSVSPACHTPPPGQRRGMQSKDFGACTTHKAARSPLTDMLWLHCGMDPEHTRPRPMPELVRCYLQEGFAATLAYTRE